VIKDIEKKPSIPIIIQILLISSLLLFVYEDLNKYQYYRYIIATISISLLFFTFLELHTLLVWQEILIGCLLIVSLLNFRFSSQRGYSSLINNFPFFVIGFCIGLLLRYRIIPRKIMYIYMVLAILPYMYIFRFFNFESIGDNLNQNRNQIPILLVPAVSLQVLNEALQERKYIVLFPSIGVLFVSYASRSRAGLFFSMGIVALVLVNNLFCWYQYWDQKSSEQKRSARYQPVLVVVIIFISLLILYELWNTSRFVIDGFSSNGRIEIYRDFLSEISVRRLLFGFRPQIMNKTHLHNSFFTMISYFGVISLYIFLIIPIALYRYLKNSWIKSGLLLVWIIYSGIERISPFISGDLILIPLLMLAYPPKRLNIKLSRIKKNV